MLRNNYLALIVSVAFYTIAITRGDDAQTISQLEVHERYLKSSKAPKATKGPKESKEPKATKGPKGPKESKAPKEVKSSKTPKDRVLKSSKAPKALNITTYS